MGVNPNHSEGAGSATADTAAEQTGDVPVEVVGGNSAVDSTTGAANDDDEDDDEIGPTLDTGVTDEANSNKRRKKRAGRLHLLELMRNLYMSY